MQVAVLREDCELILQFLEVAFAHLVESAEAGASAFRGSQKLVQLQVQDSRVAVLRALNQEEHEKRHDGRAGVDDELPGI